MCGPEPQRAECQRLLSMTLTPGMKESPDGPARDVDYRCILGHGHRGSCLFDSKRPVKA